MAIPLSLVLSVAVNILLVVHSAILSISKASHSTDVGSYIEANISQAQAQSAHFSANTCQYVVFVGRFQVDSNIHM